MSTPATPAQLAFLLKLDTEFQALRAEAHDLAGEPSQAAALRSLDMSTAREGVTKWNASKAIDTMKQRVENERKILAAVRPTTTTAAPAREELEAGMYMLGDRIFKVQVAVHGSGKPYAKELVKDTDLDKFVFEYAPGMVGKLHASDRMSLEDAKSFGALYGTCCVCGRTLTNETSIEAGIGPICSGRI